MLVKAFMIITKRPEQLAKAINDDLGRGVTFISGQGYYSQEDLKIITVLSEEMKL